MKKVLLVLALVATYGVSMAMSSSNVVIVDDAQVTIVADMDDNNVVIPEGEKEGTKTAATAKTPAKGEGCSTAKADAKAEGCSTAKADTKAEGCSGDKTAATAKSGCCSGTAKK
ncbi:MAG: hypothetical protein HQ522_10850 [Bacteroidetes bacterium]|nr:hypothetical protein [Bacteroidota bacterium]